MLNSIKQSVYSALMHQEHMDAVNIKGAVKA
jgi:hypothetical protein